MKVLLISLAIEEGEITDYHKYFRSSHLKYAEKCGYDYKFLTQPIDKSRNEAMLGDQNLFNIMQKCLVCQDETTLDYDFVVYIDADVLINIKSPPIHDYYEFGDKIGAVDEWSQPSFDKKVFVHEYYELPYRYPHEYLRREGFSEVGDLAKKVLNSGVLVFQPRKHRAHMNTYYELALKNVAKGKTMNYEQASLSHYLSRNNLLFWMDHKFNAIWNHTFSVKEITQEPLDIAQFFKDNCFLHMVERRHYHFLQGMNDINEANAIC